MSEPKTTPGPWTYNPDADHDQSAITSSDGQEVLGCHRDTSGDWCCTWRHLSDADGYLMAASPDLYAACKQMVTWYENESQQVISEMDAVRAALAKARGEDVAL